jgi:CubicO group peptidase (beta-lactamase class C family)
MKLFISLLLCSWISFTQAQQPAFITDSLDAYINKGLSDWQVPGLSVVIVKDGKIVLLKGYGVKDIVTQSPVDEQTLFMIASNTKLFTGTALAHLEAMDKLSLDDKITKYFPTYSLYDKTTTSQVSIRDLLAHRIGTKTFQGDFTFWNTSLTRAQIMQRMRLLKPEGIFRQDYGYCNSCFLTAGEVIPKVTGISWEDYITKHILQPLQMRNTYALSAGIEKRKNVAKPYTTSFTNRLTEVPYDQWDNLAPAASIVSNVNDLANWLQFQLSDGQFNGNQVMPASVLERTRNVNIITSSRKSANYPINFRGYGLGLFAADYNGRQLYWHTGGAGGMVSNVCFVPEAKLGIAILTNNDNQGFFEALRYQILDAYLGVPWVNRSERMLPGFREQMDAQIKEIQGWRDSVGRAKPELPLQAYAGNYTHPLYGSISITAGNEALDIRFNTHPDLKATMRHMYDGRWLLEYNNIEYGIFVTQFGLGGKAVKTVSIKANDFVEYDAYTFTRQAAAGKK